jgi:hypothetical protein
MPGDVTKPLLFWSVEELDAALEEEKEATQGWKLAGMQLPVSKAGGLGCSVGEIHGTPYFTRVPYTSAGQSQPSTKVAQLLLARDIRASMSMNFEEERGILKNGFHPITRIACLNKGFMLDHFKAIGFQEIKTDGMHKPRGINQHKLSLLIFTLRPA